MKFLSCVFLLTTMPCWFWCTDATKLCLPRLYVGQSSISCVCNSTYCDEVENIRKGNPGTFVIYTSTLEGLRLVKQSGKMELINPYVGEEFSFVPPFLKSPIMKINRSMRYQKVYGFGGSFSDAAGINLASLSKKTRKNLMRSYFGKDGLEFNLCRVPIGGTDYSTRIYAYNMWPEDDVKLSNFSLSEEDFKYKIPYIKEAQRMGTSEVYLIGSVWSPPAWMKINHDYHGTSVLFEKYYQTYADYHIRFLEEYKKLNIPFWALTTGNEPGVGLIKYDLNSLGWVPQQLGLWIEKYFGPTVRRSQFKNLKILAVDDLRALSLGWMEIMLEDNPKMLNYVDGLATHSYHDQFIPMSVSDEAHERYPDQFLISTETGIGSMKPYDRIQYGSWKRAEVYVKKMIDYFNHWMTGVINWNLATDMTGGPAWTKNHLESLIMVDGERDEFIKLPIYYAFGHFSKFVPRSSLRIQVDLMQGDIDCVAFLRPDNGVTVVVYNPWPTDREIFIQEDGKGFLKIDAPKQSIQTVIYW